MISIEGFVKKLKESMEEHSESLKEGAIFLPEYLKGKDFTSNVFPEVVRTLSQRLELNVRSEFQNKFLDEYEIGNPQRVDYAFMKTREEPDIFLELESLGRSQLYLFMDAEFDQENSNKKQNDNKLWYYYGTLGKHLTAGLTAPRFFIFLLILPDRQVKPYQIWDIHKEYQIFHPDLSKIVYANPFRFYNQLIRAQARAFLQSQCYFLGKNGNWKRIGWETVHKICELVFITCTMDELILSRGKDLFDPRKDRRFPILWKKR